MSQNLDTSAVAITRGNPAATPAIPTHILDNARQLISPLGTLNHALTSGRYQSPLRYPGAKSSLAPVIARVLDTAQGSREVPKISLLVEPFAGGASASLRLVGQGIVDRVLLADVDPLVTAFWQVAAADTETLIDRMRDEWNRYVKPGGATGVERWDYWRSWTPARSASPNTIRLGLAMQCLFLNRTTFSGILHGKAGPIGGRKQESPYGIGCRWNPDSIEQRLRYIGHLYDTGRLVDVWRKDWRKTLDDVPEQYPQLIPSRVIAYLDPPYLEKASHLYRASFDPSGGYGRDGAGKARLVDHMLHMQLAEYLRTKAQFRWLLSYDNNSLLTDSPWLYAHSRMTPSAEDRETLGVRSWSLTKRLVTVRYTASGKTGKRNADELLITTLPPSRVPVDHQLRRLPA
ncbi:DNA adenine methylase [Arthrobacter cupressi]|uniref:site-specific DNA-methyltransferase (adenine-specific) n=1 Tax=Arthrobacter cupressi TaxID=1045773 RepID=A0A1G8IEJ2_9MICC|nr:DNA adenine methylase [Arthrobacter cupressi]NYD78991.1 DNA adenine methylase [Arthrobacter cupressi]SDI17262.1 DNA adenine methylase [Arthrobacter cupressi]